MRASEHQGRELAPVSRGWSTHHHSAPQEIVLPSEVAGEHFHITANSLIGFLVIAFKIAAFFFFAPQNIVYKRKNETKSKQP